MSRLIWQFAAATLASLVLAAPGFAQDGDWLHATSLIGEPKYPAGFERFDYVNPDAPKGGTVRLSVTGSFDTFNPILPQGEAATGLGLVIESLMTTSLDETSTQYGLLADAMRYPEDFSSVTYRLNPKARWQDGEPVTVEDVIWTFNKMIEINPSLAAYYANVTLVEPAGEREVTFTFDQAGNRELPHIIGQVPVLPKHWWEGIGPDGNPRDIGASTLEPPMGSGPYMLSAFDPGRSVTFTRVAGYWGADEPVNVGQNNFDQIRYEFFRDTDVQFEAFKGDQFDWWLENRAQRWAQGYDFVAVQDGRVIRELFEEPYRDSGVMVAFIPNLRLEKFQNAKVREALNYTFDFEELNRTVFFDAYKRINSYFYGTDLASSSLPAGQELEILESLRDLVPEGVFTAEYINPVGGSPEALRDNLAKALELLTEAGYHLDGNRLLDANGEQLSFEILLNGPTIEVVALPWQANLERIGIAATVRTVDSPQWTNRVRARDFDMIYNGWGQSLSPGNEQRAFFGSEAAAEENSRNFAGIADPGVDALIDRIVFAEDRDALIAATKALDRVLLAHHYVIPSYTIRQARVARWDRFSHPDRLPEFSIGFPTVWWWDEAKAAKTGMP
ncbi:MAG: extracellular solute-binding protein [Cucumibacter sp.]